MKLNILILLLLGAIFENSTLKAQEANLLHHPVDRQEPVTLKALNDTATTSKVGVTIDDIQTAQGNYIDLFYNVYLIFSYQTEYVDKPALLENVSIDFIIEVEGEDSFAGNLVRNDTVTLTIKPYTDQSRVAYNYNKGNMPPYNLYDLSRVSFEFDLSQIAHLDTALLSSLNLDFVVDRGRYSTATLNPINPTFFEHDPLDPDNDLKENEAMIHWSKGPSPCTYEVEWVHVPFNDPGTQSGNIAYDFNKNAVRLQTQNTFLPVSMLHAPGFLVARGRVKRPKINQEQTAITNQFEYSHWSMDHQGTVDISDPNVLMINLDTSSTTNNLNWQYQANYALNGKKKELISYFDGTKRERQSNTQLSDFKGGLSLNSTTAVPFGSNVVAKENYYDYSGQPVIEVMPAPILGTDRFGFQDSLNLHASSKLLKADYDSLGYDSVPELNKAFNGAVQYYSDQNLWKDSNEFMKYVPDAEGFPYQRSEYMRDGSGRLKAQYRAGKELAFDDTKNTRFAYAKPTRSELERLFGTNIGLAAFYKKNIQIDPNGVMKMAYVDNQGRTVATSIAGISEGRADMEDIPFDSVYFNENLILSGADQFYESSGSYELSYPIFVATSSIYQFEYGFDVEPYQACSNVNVCYDCRYELIFQIVDENNQLLLEAKDTVIEFDHLSCLSEAYALDTFTYKQAGLAANLNDSAIEVELSAQKQYTISKVLRLKTDEIAEDARTFVDSSNCNFLGLSDFKKSELDSTDFTPCYTNFGNQDPCSEIEESLKADFTYPNGRFVKDATEDSLITLHLYNQLREVSGCVEMDSLTLEQFTADFLAHFNLTTPPTFQEFEEEYIDYLIHFHPTFCQLTACRQYRNPTSIKFNRILEESDSIQEFVALAKGAGFMPNNDSIYFTSGTNLIESIAANSEGDTLLFEYDSTLQILIDSGVFTDFYNPYFINDTVSYYDFDILPQSRFCHNRHLASYVTWEYIQSYFTNYNGNCDTTSTYNQYPSLFGISGIMSQIPTGDIDKWRVYKTLYLNAKEMLITDLLNSLVCFQYDVNENCVAGGDYRYPWDSVPHYRAYDHFVGGSHSMSHWLDTNNLESYVESTRAIASSNETIANQVYALLLADSCISLSDSAGFVNNVEISILMCDPFGHLDTLGGYLNCDPLLTNISSVLAPFKKHYADTSGNQLYPCQPVYQEHYNCVDFTNAHTDFINAIGASEVPSVSSASQISIFNEKQKKYANWMNFKLGLTLSFADYYNFAYDCTLNGGVTVFSQQVELDLEVKVEKIREVAIGLSNEYLKTLTEAQRFDTLNANGLDGTANELNSSTDYLGFGEVNLSNNQCDLYYLEDGQLSFNKVLDTMNEVFNTIKDSLQLISDFENHYEANCTQINLDQYTAVNGMSSILVDRAYRYSSGTVWVRLLKAADSSYYNDYYFHYEPYNRIYRLNEVNSFASIYPVFDQEELYYARLTIETIGAEMLVSTASTIDVAARVSQVELCDYVGKGIFPKDKGCEDLKYERAQINAAVKHEEYQKALQDTFKMEYRSFCLNEAISNQYLNMGYVNAERQFTLYYYDNAGNTVMTVPPGGVDIGFNYDEDTAAKVLDYRTNNNATLADQVLPEHSKRTIYKYNSDNQVIRQVTPNSDTIYTWHDKAGRKVLTQDGDQAETNAFSYMLYDSESRPVETGEVVLNEFAGLKWGDIHAVLIVGVFDTIDTQIDELIRSKSRNDVVKNYYDVAVLNSAPTNFEQKNLRSKVTTKAYYKKMDSSRNKRDWDYAMHFSYDATGNVKSMLNDYYQNGRIDDDFDRFKQLDYAYDVLSGQVIQVYYQTGEKDAFYHRYEYDAENRLTKVETSRDGIIWDEDANYKYYLHGPLARTELGEHNVQGMDYTYNLQGWLKSVNSGHRKDDTGEDQEKDNVFAEDAFGFALQYHQNDYRSIGDVNSHLIEASTDTTRSDLYNGNIAALTMHNQSNSYGKEYRYDQIDRLKSMMENEVNEDSLKWQGALANGNNSYYEYDKNGNILHLSRYDGEEERLMDDMHYTYEDGTDKLSSVDDTVSTTAFSNDIDQQNSGNYAYDKRGNLIADTAESICRTQWYPNGKLKRIVRFTPTKQRPNLWFDYDANGNRIKKTIMFLEGDKSYLRTTYYVRDHQGNIMATYEERDCDYYEGEDSLGVYYYQYTENFLFYTNQAVDQVGVDSLVNFLAYGMNKKEELLEESYLNLNQIPHIRDSIMAYLDIEDYLSLYPGAKNRVLSQELFKYAEYLFNHHPDSFVNLVNDKHEVWIQYLHETDSIEAFYADIDSLYTLVHGNSYNQQFYNLKHELLLSNRSDESLIKGLLNINNSEYDDLLDCIDDHGLAVRELDDLMTLLQDSLNNGASGNVTKSYLKLITARLLLISYSDKDFKDIFRKIVWNSLIDALSWLPADMAAELNSILHHIYMIDNNLVEYAGLSTYKPMVGIDWTADNEGKFLKHFIHTDHASNWMLNLTQDYFQNAYLKQYDIFFSSSTSVRNYVANAMFRNISDDLITIALANKVGLTKSILIQTENLAYLTNYFKIFHPAKTHLQNYYHDSLQSSLQGLPHYSPYDYARELNQNIAGLNLGQLAGCSPHRIYLVPERFEMYGSKRLGVMDARKERRVADHVFSRKLGAKEYELSDHLGNVVATVSDKKLHPQELLQAGETEIDTTLGFQAEVTGRYDYWPFGMEIMSRSGDFTTVDYSTDVNKLLYDGLLKSCNSYDIVPQLYGSGNPKTLDSIYCDLDTNLYGQTFVNSLRVDQYWEHQAWNGQHKIEFTVDLRLDKVVGTVDPDGIYTIQFEVSSMGRRVFGVSPEHGVESNGVSGATLDDIRHTQIKFVTFNYNGAELDSMATAGIITFHLRASWGESGEYWDNFVEIKSMRVTQTFENTTVPLAMRKGNSFAYGFNGQIRDDEMKGSGNSYAFKYRVHDPRLGRFLSVDPLMKYYPMSTPYAFAQNRVIQGIDIEGAEYLEANLAMKFSTWYAKLKVGSDNMIQAAANTGSYNNQYISSDVKQKIRLSQASQGAQAVSEAAVEAGEFTAEMVNNIPGVDVVGDPMLAAYYGSKGDYSSAAAYAAASAVPLASGYVLKKATTVLGHFPEYIKLAEKLEANKFSIPDDIWNKMDDAQRWSANKKFLDRAVERGDNIELATPIDEVNPDSYLRREIDYLTKEKGYRVNKKGNSLIPPADE